MAVTIKFRRGNARDFAYNNSILAPGEPGFELDTGKLKIGNGKDHWNDLKYINGDVSLSPDEKSLVIDSNGIISIYGYQNAEVGQIPIKTSNGISWIILSEIAKTGDIKDLKQTQTFELYGGSAVDLINSKGGVDNEPTI